MKHFQLIYILTFICILLCIPGCMGNESYYLSEGEIFHTSYHIKYKYDRPLKDEILIKLSQFSASLNPFDSTSIISKINRNEPVEVDTLFIRVFRKANDVSMQSHGAFDITCAPLVNLWGFGFQHINKVTPEVVDSLKKFVGYNLVQLKNRRIVKKDPRVQLNCSAIAKGYATDLVAQLLDSCGITDYMVEIGGEIRAKGKNPNGTCWKIEIPRPIDDKTGLISQQQAVIDICDKSIATSGNYRNYYIKDGKKYAHTIDPHTGYPAENDMLSASVIANDCMTADAYATAFMTLGMTASCQLIDNLEKTKHESLDYYFIYLDEEGKMQIKTSLSNP